MGEGLSSSESRFSNHPEAVGWFFDAFQALLDQSQPRMVKSKVDDDPHLSKVGLPVSVLQQLSYKTEVTSGGSLRLPEKILIRQNTTQGKNQAERQEMVSGHPVTLITCHSVLPSCIDAWKKEAERRQVVLNHIHIASKLNPELGVLEYEVILNGKSEPLLRLPYTDSRINFGYAEGKIDTVSATELGYLLADREYLERFFPEMMSVGIDSNAIKVVVGSTAGSMLRSTFGVPQFLKKGDSLLFATTAIGYNPSQLAFYTLS